MYLYRRWNSDNESGEISQTDMNFEKSLPDDQNAETEDASEDETEETFDHPYDVGKMIVVGENQNLGAKLEILEYNEDREEVYCKLWIEAPVGSKIIRPDYSSDTDYELGSAFIEYQDANGNGHNVEIGLADEKIAESSYTLVIEVSQSIFEDIR